MNVAIQIYFTSNENEVLRRNSVPARGKSKEQLAFEWWRQIKREMPYGAELQKVIADGEDITEIIKEKERALLG